MVHTYTIMLTTFDGGRSSRVWDIVTDETWIFQYDPETKQQSALCMVFPGGIQVTEECCKTNGSVLLL